MNMINMPAKEANYYFEAQIKLTEKLISAIKKYWAENSHMILLGLSVTNGNIPFGYFNNK